jgi:hypothetical protein
MRKAIFYATNLLQRSKAISTGKDKSNTKSPGSKFRKPDLMRFNRTRPNIPTNIDRRRNDNPASTLHPRSASNTIEQKNKLESALIAYDTTNRDSFLFNCVDAYPCNLGIFRAPEIISHSIKSRFSSTCLVGHLGSSNEF